MVEGHGVHRVAALHRKRLVGKCFKATSPNGRFREGAAAINGKKLVRVEAVGKNLFHFFDAKPVICVRTHFGMSGQFRVHQLPGPPQKPTTRLELLHEKEGLVAHCSAMTLLHGDMELFESRRRSLGPDPLREDADPERLWAALQGCKRPIGEVLMDQSKVCGVGNIFRAEILYKARTHPEQPAYSISRTTFIALWHHCVELLQRGFQSGSILTVDPADATRLGQPWTRRYIYNQEHCGNCGSRVRSWPDKNKRTNYCCPKCQPLLRSIKGSDEGKSEMVIDIPESRQQAMDAASGSKVFLSHCAPDTHTATSSLAPAKMKVSQLKKELKKLGLPSTGKKAVLVSRLQEAREPSSAIATPSSAIATPGSAHLEKAMLSAAQAVLEKLDAGESRAVEHVAEGDDASLAQLNKPASRSRVRKRKADKRDKQRVTYDQLNKSCG